MHSRALIFGNIINGWEHLRGGCDGDDCDCVAAPGTWCFKWLSNSWQSLSEVAGETPSDGEKYVAVGLSTIKNCQNTF